MRAPLRWSCPVCSQRVAYLYHRLLVVNMMQGAGRALSTSVVTRGIRGVQLGRARGASLELVDRGGSLRWVAGSRVGPSRAISSSSSSADYLSLEDRRALALLCHACVGMCLFVRLCLLFSRLLAGDVHVMRIRKKKEVPL